MRKTVHIYPEANSYASASHSPLTHVAEATCWAQHRTTVWRVRAADHTRAPAESAIAANELAPRLEDRCSPYDRSLTCARPGARTTHHTKLDQALARLRKGFKRNEILPGWHVEMVEEKAYSHRDDELGSMALLTLPAVLTLEPLS